MNCPNFRIAGSFDELLNCQAEIGLPKSFGKRNSSLATPIETVADKADCPNFGLLGLFGNRTKLGSPANETGEIASRCRRVRQSGAKSANEAIRPPRTKRQYIKVDGFRRLVIVVVCTSADLDKWQLSPNSIGLRLTFSPLCNSGELPRSTSDAGTTVWTGCGGMDTRSSLSTAAQEEASRCELALGKRFFPLLVVPEGSPVIGQPINTSGVPVPFWNP